MTRARRKHVALSLVLVLIAGVVIVGSPRALTYLTFCRAGKAGSTYATTTTAPFPTTSSTAPNIAPQPPSTSPYQSSPATGTDLSERPLTEEQKAQAAVTAEQDAFVPVAHGLRLSSSIAGSVVTDRDGRSQTALIFTNANYDERQYPLPSGLDYVERVQRSNDPNVLYVSNDSTSFAFRKSDGSFSKLGDISVPDVSPSGNWLVGLEATKLHVEPKKLLLFDVMSGKSSVHTPRAAQCGRKATYVKQLGWNQEGTRYFYTAYEQHDYLATDHTASGKIYAFDPKTKKDSVVCTLSNSVPKAMLGNGQMIVESDDGSHGVTDAYNCNARRLPSEGIFGQSIGTAVGPDGSHIIFNVGTNTSIYAYGLSSDQTCGS